MSSRERSSQRVQGRGSLILKRSVVVNGKKTSASIEQSFWLALIEIAHLKKVTLGALVSQIDQERQHSNLSSCIRLFVLDFYRRTQAVRSNGGDAYTAAEALPGS
jgi:predicted DNA-binding ribbon-helix-helix protein